MKIENGAFSYCLDLLIFEFDENSNYQSIDKGVFKESDNVLLMIPNKLKDHFHVYINEDDIF